jgi:hypothetical protein
VAIGAEGATNIQTFPVRQHPVGHDHVGDERERGGRRGANVPGVLDPVSHRLEHHPIQLPRIRVVVHDEHKRVVEVGHDALGRNRRMACQP